MPSAEIDNPVASSSEVAGNVVDGASGAAGLSAPGVGAVEFGSLHRKDPISRVFGFDRGQCIDRRYIERFLARHAEDVRGRVLEVGDDSYTRQFGGDRVTRSDVLHFTRDNRKATIVADLTDAESLVSGSFDCIILTQTLQHIFDTRSAINTIRRILAPGGVALVTAPGISQISRYDMDRWGDFWRFTTLSMTRLWQEVFPADMVEVEAFGNVFAATAFLHGLAVEDVNLDELDHHDPDYQLLITVRAQAPEVAQ